MIGAIGNVKIHIRRRQPHPRRRAIHAGSRPASIPAASSSAVINIGVGIGTRSTSDCPARRIPCRQQPRLRLPRNRIMRVRGIVTPAQQHHAQAVTKQARLSICPPVSSPGTPSAQPDHRTRRPDNPAAPAPSPAASHPTFLSSAQQTSLGHQHRALAVHMHRPAFNNLWARDNRRARSISQHLGRHRIIQIPRKIQSLLQPAPSVERPVHPRAIRPRRCPSKKLGIPHPAHHASFVLTSTTRTAAGNNRPRLRKLPRTHHHRHRLKPGNRRSPPPQTLPAPAWPPTANYHVRSGQIIQHPACGSHSAGMRNPSCIGVLMA